MSRHPWRCRLWSLLDAVGRSFAITAAFPTSWLLSSSVGLVWLRSVHRSISFDLSRKRSPWLSIRRTGQPPISTVGSPRDTLKQFHASSSCLKSMCTGVTAAGIEDCRKACGGHGFLQSSGIPEHLGAYLQSCTVEGENHMLTQQVC